MLIRNGFPVDVAFQADEVFRTAACIVFSQFDGERFNFQTMSFEEGV